MQTQTSAASPTARHSNLHRPARHTAAAWRRTAGPWPLDERPSVPHSGRTTEVPVNITAMSSPRAAGRLLLILGVLLAIGASGARADTLIALGDSYSSGE